MKDRELAVSIARCDEVEHAVLNKTHPCHEIVLTQAMVPSRHLPEPWYGNLSAARVLFISSNPSIDDNHDQSGENYPRAEWSNEDVGEWFVRRVDQDWDEVPVSFRHREHGSFRWRCIDGIYRGAGKNRKSPQPTWNKTHARAIELLGPDADPSENYALTEVVHCKSQREMGVSAAVSFCSSKWLNPVINTAENLRVLVVCGSKARDLWAKSFFDLPDHFGAKKRSNESQLAIARRDLFVASQFGKPVVVVYMGQPAFSSSLLNLYGPKVVEVISEIAREVIPIPSSTDALIRHFI